ncbi:MULTISPECIES: TcmI family type II polyketide cyclase [Streptomyces]|nr:MULTISPECIES: TcmI family type II polyketide cyclase [Streptomyces]
MSTADDSAPRRTLIVARMDPRHAETAAALFARSDEGGLPRDLGVTSRSLFSFHGLYMHLVESGPDLPSRLEGVRDRPDYAELNNALARYITPYDPETWRGPRDAMAHRFYQWPPAGS